MFIVDAHEDLAWNILAFGRDYTRSAAETRAREAGTALAADIGQALFGWPDWIEGDVGIVFATLYASRSDCQLCDYRHSQVYHTPVQANRIFRQQLEVYHTLVAEHPDKFYLIQSQADLAAGLAAWDTSPPEKRRVGLALLMESAEGISHPAEVSDWFAAGIRIIGPAWQGTRYTAGWGEPGGFTPLGRELLRHMAETGMILDLSHLSDGAIAEALADYPGPIIASHCNARALLPGRYAARHLSDSMIRRLAEEREGVIGIVLFKPFVKAGVKMGDPRHLVTLEDVAAHIDHMAQLVGHTRHIGLGSDMDGGFGLEDVPVGIDSVATLGRIGEALDRRGYSAEAVAGIMGGNWLRLLERALPMP